MANTLYDGGREGFLDSSIDWVSDTIKVSFVGVGYVPDPAADRFFADLPGGEIIATSAALTGKTATAGIADADDYNFAAVAGADIHFVVAFQDTGDPTTSRLIGVIDDAANMPYTPTGGPIAISWDSGPDKIFKL